MQTRTVRANGYGKLEQEDPEDRKHREARFLIYRILEQADEITVVKKGSSRSRIRLRIRKLKVKVGKRLKRMRKTIVSRMSKVLVFKSSVCILLKQIIYGKPMTAAASAIASAAGHLHAPSVSFEDRNARDWNSSGFHSSVASRIDSHND
ncbi:hypothetical protein AKJ16_DCAP08020 [Drosera capensis]